MVELLAAEGITDPFVLQAMGCVPRHEFVPLKMRELSYVNAPVAIGLEQTISQPFIVAYMIQMANVGPHDIVLDIGTGSGYAAAILSRIVKKVYTIERIPSLAFSARKVCLSLGYHNITFGLGDGTQGWQTWSPYNVIIGTAAIPKVPDVYIDQVTQEGTVIVPVGTRNSQFIYRICKQGCEVRIEKLICVRFVPMLGKNGMYNTY